VFVVNMSPKVFWGSAPKSVSGRADTLWVGSEWVVAKLRHNRFPNFTDYVDSILT